MNGGKREREKKKETKCENEAEQHSSMILRIPSLCTFQFFLFLLAYIYIFFFSCFSCKLFRVCMQKIRLTKWKYFPLMHFFFSCKIVVDHLLDVFFSLCH